MQKLVWQNANGVELDLTSGNYGITDWEGFSNASLNIQSQQVPFQDGGVFLDALIEQRELSVTLAMQDRNNLELRYQQRRELISALNPKLGEGYLIYTNDFISKRIKCVPQIPLFETHNSDTVGTPKASLSWTACNPYWEDLKETFIEIEKGDVLNISNEGDIQTLPTIEIDGVLENPIIINRTTNKAIKLNMTTDKNIIISTETGKKGIYTLKADYKIKSGDFYFDSIVVGNNTILVGIDICIINEFGVETHINSPVSYNIICIGYANGVYIAGTKGGGILRSEDALKWDVVYTPSDGGGDIEKISCVNNVWFANGWTSQVPAKIAYSEDNGITWTFTGKYEFYQDAGYVIYYNNSYYIYNRVYLRVTTDFENWTSIQPANLPSDIIEIEPNHWIGVSGGNIVEATDPTTWNVIATPTNNSLSKIQKINDKYFGLGYETIVVNSGSLYDWGETSISMEEDVTAKCGYFILGEYSFYDTKGNIYKTTDLSEWTEQKAENGSFADITKRFGKYIVLYNDNVANKRYLLESEDGENFAKIEVLSSSQLKGQIFDGQRLIINSYNKLYITENGVDITEKDLNMTTDKLYYVNGKYFISTYYNQQYTTFYGEDLDNLENLGVQVAVLTFYNGVYYRGAGNKLYSSQDLETWEELFTIPNLGSSTNFTDIVIFNNSLIIATVSDTGARNTSRIYCFQDLSDFSIYKTYTKSPSGITKFFEYNGDLWCCGQYGQIGKSSNGYIWSIQTTAGRLSSLYIDEKKLAVGAFESVALMIEVIKTDEVDKDNNLISRMSTDSELNWQLLQGENNIQFTSDSGTGKAIVSYRQKYIGV